MIHAANLLLFPFVRMKRKAVLPYILCEGPKEPKMTGINCLIAAGASGYESLDSIANPLARLEAEVLNNSNLAILAVLPGDAPAWYEA